MFRNSEGAMRGNQFIELSEMVICLALFFFRHTNELRNFALTTQQRKFLFAALNMVCFWCCKTRGV